ncbi:MAG TPA: cytochrome c oxidase subunit II [Anaerolineales bacterium]
MTILPPAKPRRVLIASSHPLFGQGLRRLLQERQGAGVVVVGMVSNLDQALTALEKLDPDLIIVDYDDVVLNRDEFLARFVEGEKKLRVVLLSLQSAQNAIIYDRRTLAASQIDNWLEEWNYADDSQVLPHLARETGKTVENRRSDMKHFVIAGLLVVVVTALLIFGLGHVRLLPVQASAQAVPIDNLFSLEFKIIAFLFSLIVVFMIYSIVVFRRKRGDLTDAAHIEGNRRLEVLWTIAPLFLVLYLAYLGSQSLAETMRAAPHPLEVKVVAAQWSWRFEYPDTGIISDKLVLPVNKQTLLHLTSLDVIHDFWVPEFRVKQDILPGGDQFIRDLRITPTLVGNYKVRCAQMCGLRHAYMEGPVQVVSQADFDAWVASQTATSADPVARGQKAAQQFGCVACHSIDGSKLVGPTWKGLAGSTVTLSDGSTVTADDAYLIESIRQPGAKIVQGFADIMPHTIAANMTDAQVQDIIAFIKSLK